MTDSNEEEIPILIVDDEREIISAIEGYLKFKRPNFKINRAHNGKQALDRITSGELSPRVVLTDLKMPEMNGLAFTKELVNTRPDISIILMSAFLTNIESVEAVNMGVCKIIDKPIKLSQLLESIEEVLDAPEKQHSEYIPVKLDQVVQGEIYVFNIFISLNGKKFIKIFNQGDHVQQERLDSYQEKGCDTLYIVKEDFLDVEDKLFLPIRASTLIMDKNIPFDVYIKSSAKYKRLFPSNTNYKQPHKQVLSKHKVKRLFIEDKFEPEYQSYLESVIDPIINNIKLEAEEKANAVSDYSVNKIQTTYHNPNERNIKQMKKVSSNVEKFLMETGSKGLNKLLEIQKSGNVYKHALNVASLSFSIITEIFAMRKDRKLKSKVAYFDKTLDDNQKTRDIVIQAGLFHDIGMALLGVSSGIQQEDGEEAQSELEEKLKKHPEAAIEKLKNNQNIHDKVPEVVAQHEEFCDGSGFPKGLKKNQLSIFSQIISLANYYDNKVDKEKLTPKEAINDIKMNITKFNNHIVVVFERVISLAQKSSKDDESPEAEKEAA
jgi:response regulator RpfG family c-di-GMP phosphodiesterase